MYSGGRPLPIFPKNQMLSPTLSSSRTIRVTSRFDRADRMELTPSATALLRAARARRVGIRDEVVARARALAADPSYPSKQVLHKVAEQILCSGDLLEPNS